MENTESIKPYTFTELLPILLAFSQSQQLCDRALDDHRLTAVHADTVEAISEVHAAIGTVINLLSDATVGR